MSSFLARALPIVEVNAVRKHVSAIKGGRLAARVAPARLVSLTVSDVAGDVLDAITDPSVQDTSTVDDALEILHRRGLWDALPPSIREHLASDAAHSPVLATEPQTVMLVNGAGVCEAMAAEAQAAGVNAHVVSTELEGEASFVGRHLAELAASCARDGAPAAPPCVLVGCGGESTVTLASNGAGGSFGAGGPESGGGRSGGAPPWERERPSPPASSTPTARMAARTPQERWSTASPRSAQRQRGSTSRRLSRSTARARHWRASGT